MEYYLALKNIHVACAALSGAGFLVRGFWMWTGHPWHGRPLTRSVPHVVDTLLLASAVAMAWTASLSPVAHSWLAAKLVALVVYIILGAVALRGATRARRGVALLAAAATYFYIVGVALTRDPTWILT